MRWGRRSRNFPFDEQSLPIDFVMPSEKVLGAGRRKEGFLTRVGRFLRVRESFLRRFDSCNSCRETLDSVVIGAGVVVISRLIC